MHTLDSAVSFLGYGDNSTLTPLIACIVSGEFDSIMKERKTKSVGFELDVSYL